MNNEEKITEMLGQLACRMDSVEALEAEIKPCPFCGATLEEDKNSPFWLWHPSNGCILAEAQVDLTGFGPLCICKTNFDEVSKWNRRIES